MQTIHNDTWEENALRCREEKLDRWLRVISLMTKILIAIAATDILCYRFFFYQQLEHGVFIYSRYHSLTVCRLVMGIAMLKLSYTVPFSTKATYPSGSQPKMPQAIWILIFAITIILNHNRTPADMDDPYILNIYHWTQTISYILIVVLNRLSITLITRRKKWVYQGINERNIHIAVAIVVLSSLANAVLAEFCAALPKFFY